MIVPLRTEDVGPFRPQIQDTDDKYFKIPKALLEGCSCRKDCTLSSKKCRCMSSEDRGKSCSRLTCKFCLCFKRAKDSLDENLQLSTEYQRLLDDISDESDCSATDESESSDCSDTELYFSDFDDLVMF